MDWDNEKCLELIEAYRLFRCLWDPTYGKYKNKSHKEEAWQQIATILKCSSEEVKRKMESLLASHRRERQKSRSVISSSGTKTTYKSRWFAFKSMHFLMDNYKPRKILNAYISDNIDDSTNEQAFEQYEQEGFDGMGSDRSHSPEAMQPPTPTQKSGKAVTQSPDQMQTKKFKTEDPRVSEAYNILKDTYQSKIRDRSQAFGNNVAAKHREYSQRTKTFVEHYINNILFEADMGKYDSNLTSDNNSQNPPADFINRNQSATMEVSIVEQQNTTAASNLAEAASAVSNLAEESRLIKVEKP